MLTAADLEVNVLDFHQRSFQFERLVEVGGRSYALFSRTETENERQLRPRLVRLIVVAPQEWVVVDDVADLLRIGQMAGGSEDPTVVEVAADRTEFEERGQAWRRVSVGTDTHVYLPLELAEGLLAPSTRVTLGLPFDST